jgi:hypothetical protein
VGAVQNGLILMLLRSIPIMNVLHISGPDHSNDKCKLSLFELLSLYIVVLSLVAVSLLVAGQFNSLKTIVLGTIVTIAFIILSKSSIQINTSFNHKDLLVLLILLVAFFFRAEPYLWISGGQDPGIYVNMSASYERTGKIFIKDTLRENLSSSDKQIYDKYSHLHVYSTQEGKYEGAHFPGVYIKNLPDSEYVYQFYPLHPLWMALFANILGSDNRVYAVVFFALLSIYAFYLLAFELSDKKRLPAFLTAFLLAVNPLHAFFSKLPVSEVVSSFFASTGFYFLVKYYRDSRTGTIRPFNLVLSSGLFFCLFLNHIAGFLYLPLFYGVLLIAGISEDDMRVRRHLLIYSCGILALFGLSVMYGYHFSYPYFYDIYRMGFGAYLGVHWMLILPAAAASLLLAAALMIAMRNKLRPFLQMIAPFVFKSVPLIIFAMMLYGIYQAYCLGFTDKYAGHDIDTIFHLSKKGFSSLPASSLFVLVSYASPFIFVIFLIALRLSLSMKDVVLLGLVFHIAVSFFMRIVLDNAIGYQYYYARYMLGELLPSIILFSMISLDAIIHKNIMSSRNLYILIALASLYFVAFSSFQVFAKGKEADGTHEALNEIASHLQEKDILVVQPNTIHYHLIATPLTYYYGLNVFPVGNLSELPTLDNFNTIYYLSQVPSPDKNLELKDIICFKRGVFEHTQKRIPSKFSFEDISNFYLYSYRRTFNAIYVVNYPYLKNFYSDKIWTNGKGMITHIGYELQPDDKYLILETKGYNPYKNDLTRLNLKVLANGQPLTFHHSQNRSYYFEMNKRIIKVEEVKILSSTFIPAESVQGSTDQRTLGIDVENIRFSKE